MARFDTCEGCLWSIKLKPQSFVLSRCGDNKDYCGTKTLVLENWYVQFFGRFLDTIDTVSYD